jgi:TonB family protein
MRARITSAIVVLGVGVLSVHLAAQSKPTSFADAFRPGQGVTDPAVLKEVRPQYTSEALRAKIAGTVEIEAVVEPNGTIQTARVTKSLDSQLGLDQEALRAARQWLFKPGYREGKPVPVVITMILEFRVHQGPPQTPPVPPAAPMGTGGGAPQADEDFYKGAYREATPGVIPPRARFERRPNYTAEAMRQKIQGLVEIEAVVMPDGSVARARVKTSLDKTFGLDEEALRAARQWTFEPNSGTLNKQPVPVVVRLFLEFRLH